jgi:hypothetical protein
LIQIPAAAWLGLWAPERSQIWIKFGGNVYEAPSAPPRLVAAVSSTCRDDQWHAPSFHLKIVESQRKPDGHCPGAVAELKGDSPVELALG